MQEVDYSLAFSRSSKKPREKIKGITYDTATPLHTRGGKINDTVDKGWVEY